MMALVLPQLLSTAIEQERLQEDVVPQSRLDQARGPKHSVPAPLQNRISMSLSRPPTSQAATRKKAVARRSSTRPRGQGSDRQAWTTSTVIVVVIIGAVVSLLIVGYTPEAAVTAVVAAGIGAVEVLRRLADVVRGHRGDE